ncbi:MAG: hypothetical protein LUH19_05990, partial [Lachnospiraceae bacterium]|nr:hypothetical protein [Lachnospiraceae bacterium]
GDSMKKDKATSNIVWSRLFLHDGSGNGNNFLRDGNGKKWIRSGNKEEFLWQDFQKVFIGAAPLPPTSAKAAGMRTAEARPRPM